jgi:hypothetical protein
VTVRGDECDVRIRGRGNTPQYALNAALGAGPADCTYEVVVQANCETMTVRTESGQGKVQSQRVYVQK